MTAPTYVTLVVPPGYCWFVNPRPESHVKVCVLPMSRLISVALKDDYADGVGIRVVFHFAGGFLLSPEAWSRATEGTDRKRLVDVELRERAVEDEGDSTVAVVSATEREVAPPPQAG